MITTLILTYVVLSTPANALDNPVHGEIRDSFETVQLCEQAKRSALADIEHRQRVEGYEIYVVSATCNQNTEGE